MEINITYKSPEHEAAFLSELQRIPCIVNPESGRINPYWGASLYLLSALTRWPELRIAVIGEDYMAFAAAKEAFNLSQNERIIVELVTLVAVERLEERVNLLFGLYDLLNPNVQNVVLLILLIQRPIDSSHGTGLLTSRL